MSKSEEQTEEAMAEVLSLEKDTSYELRMLRGQFDQLKLFCTALAVAQTAILVAAIWLLKHAG